MRLSVHVTIFPSFIVVTQSDNDCSREREGGGLGKVRAAAESHGFEWGKGSILLYARMKYGEQSQQTCHFPGRCWLKVQIISNTGWSPRGVRRNINCSVCCSRDIFCFPITFWQYVGHCQIFRNISISGVGPHCTMGFPQKGGFVSTRERTSGKHSCMPRQLFNFNPPSLDACRTSKIMEGDIPPYSMGDTDIADLGWVDLVFGCTSVSQILLGRMRITQFWHSSRARGRGGTVKINFIPTQVRDRMPLPVVP